MKKRIYNQTSLFGELYAFLIVISPPTQIKEEVAKIKQSLNAIAGINERNLHSIAHITLTDTLTDDSDLADTIAELLIGQKPFTIRLKDWKVFDHGHSTTLYLDIQNQEPVVSLMKLLKSASKSPHLTLAKKIPHTTLAELQPYLAELSYEAEWTCTEVTVLRKLMSEKHLGWRESFTIPLKG